MSYFWLRISYEFAVKILASDPSILPKVKGSASMLACVAVGRRLQVSVDSLSGGLSSLPCG